MGKFPKADHDKDDVKKLTKKIAGLGISEAKAHTRAPKYKNEEEKQEKRLRKRQKLQVFAEGLSAELAKTREMLEVIRQELEDRGIVPPASQLIRQRRTSLNVSSHSNNKEAGMNVEENEKGEGDGAPALTSDLGRSFRRTSRNRHPHHVNIFNANNNENITEIDGTKVVLRRQRRNSLNLNTSNLELSNPHGANTHVPSRNRSLHFEVSDLYPSNSDKDAPLVFPMLALDAMDTSS